MVLKAALFWLALLFCDAVIPVHTAMNAATALSTSGGTIMPSGPSA